MGQPPYPERNAHSDAHEWPCGRPVNAMPDDLLTLQLHYEQHLNRLGQRLSQILTTCLERDGTTAEGAVFLELLKVLHLSLPGTVVAIAQPESSPSPHFVIRHVALPNPGVLPASGHLNASLPLELQVGQQLSVADLSYLYGSPLRQVWELRAKSTAIAALVICLRPAASQQPAPHSHPVTLETNFIERVLSQCSQTLEHICLIQRQHHRNQELLAHNQELQQTNQLKSEFLANTSHEIRTPLSSILGFTHLMREQGFSSTNLRHQEYLNIILSSGQHLLALINDILDLSKIEANQLDLQRETLDVRDSCQMAMTLVRERAVDKGLELQLDIAPEVTTVVADPLRLNQMLFNLLSNAVKFTPQGRVGLTVARQHDFLLFTVWDTGVGISEEQQRLLFKPYSQIANTAVGREEGTGLGLALTQKLAELHGGWATAQSELNQGSRFTVALPWSAIAESSDSLPLPSPGSDPTPSPVSVSRSTGEVLLVEDNHHNAKLMLTYLSKLGYRVTWACNGEEMWQVLSRSRPDLILMDVNLPEVDGLELTRQLQTDSRYQTIPVIAQTALAMKGDRDLCLEAGAVDYISKPINLTMLAALVAQYVSAPGDSTTV